MSRRSRSSRSLLPIVLGFALLAVTAVLATFLSNRQQHALFWVRHTLEVESSVDAVRVLALQAEAGARGYQLTDEPFFLEPYGRAIARLPGAVDGLARLVDDNPMQRARVEAVREEVGRKLVDLRERVALQQAGRGAQAAAMLKQPDRRGTLSRLTTMLGAIRTREEALYTTRQLQAKRLTEATEVALALSVLLVMVMALWSINDARDRYTALARTNERLAGEITERDRAEAQLRQLQKMESLGRLTGGVAHDFNNMLAVVIGSLDLAKRRLTGTEHPRLADGIASAQEAAERAALLTARLLAFSRQQPLEPKPLEPNKLVAGTSELLRRTLGEAVLIETVLGGGLWRACADAAQLESAIVNLAINARDAMPDGGRLTIETANVALDESYVRDHPELKSGQYVMISVTDTGAGMPPEVRERAFDPFFTTKDVGKGTGLGLSQVFGFVKQSEGHVAIYSEPGHGTTVKLYLPRYHGAAASGGAQGGAAAGDHQPPIALPGETVLVVEDEDQVRRMTVGALRELGYGVTEADRGTHALAILESDVRIDLMLTDIVMPGMNGRELADRAVVIRPGLKVIYTTGYTRNAVVHNGVVDAGLAFLPKPFPLAALARKLRDVLDG